MLQLLSSCKIDILPKKQIKNSKFYITKQNFLSYFTTSRYKKILDKSGKDFDGDSSSSTSFSIMNEFQRSNSKTTDVSTFSPVRNDNRDVLSKIKVEGNSPNSQFYGIAEIAIQTNGLFSSNMPNIVGKSKFFL